MSQPTDGGRYYRVNGQLIAEADYKPEPAKPAPADAPAPAAPNTKVSPAKVGGPTTAEENK